MRGVSATSSIGGWEEITSSWMSRTSRPGSGSRKQVWFLAAAALLLLGLGWVAIGPWSEYRARQATLAEMFTTARSQQKRGEYESAFKAWNAAVKMEPRNRAAIDGQVDAA